MKNFIKRIINDTHSNPTPDKTYITNCYHLNEIEYKRMMDLGSNTVKLSSSNGIGISAECLVKGEWVDITDYDSW